MKSDAEFPSTAMNSTNNNKNISAIVGDRFSRESRSLSHHHHHHHRHRSIINDQSMAITGDGDNSGTRAPLLETISILASSSFIYSDRSSSSSSLPSPSQSPTPPSELSDHNDVDGMMINDNEIQFLTKNNIQSSDIAKLSISAANQDSDSNDQLLQQRSSRVRFSNEVQVNKEKQDNNDRNYNAINSINDPLISIFQSNHDKPTAQTCSSSSTSTLNSNPSIDQTISVTDIIPTTSSSSSYANVSSAQFIQTRTNNQQHQIQQWNPSITSAMTRKTTPLQSTGFKSILKDPLCAKLRYSLSQSSNIQANNVIGIDAINCNGTTIDRPIITASQKKSINNSSSVNENNQSLLESQIDQLFYGPIDSTNTMSNPMDQSTRNDNVAEKFSNKTNKSIKNHIRNDNNDINRMPCLTFIQMIEDKYRQQSQLTKSNSNTFNHSNTIHNNGSQQESKTNKSRAKTSCNNSNQSSNSRSNRQSSNINRRIHASIMSSSNDYRIEPTILMPITSIVQRNHCSLDQWMATLAQESKNNKPQIISDDSKRFSKNESKSLSNESIESIKAANANGKFRQEELYTLLSDPIKGPSINRLMDQLSNWSESFENEQTTIDSIIATTSTPTSTTIANSNGNSGISNNNFTAKILNSNNSHTIGIDQPISFEPSLNRSTSPSSSCSTSTTARSRSTLATVDNHIYEEILYEGLHHHQQQQQYQQNHL
nr:putative uncharacterized protein DDB_G0289263 isoform X1 [Dermatophagoides farinae]XP_046918557.1 putative uncharacterized protein DDB_G0289263 isoform X1 [Dermatophagoides farinae]XP_046918558.1 putative uncharacterized protein DDB_G0289263 isoform X1 [Dermatophagoides farinae]